MLDSDLTLGRRREHAQSGDFPPKTDAKRRASVGDGSPIRGEYGSQADDLATGRGGLRRRITPFSRNCVEQNKTIKIRRIPGVAENATKTEINSPGVARTGPISLRPRVARGAPGTVATAIPTPAIRTIAGAIKPLLSRLELGQATARSMFGISTSVSATAIRVGTSTSVYEPRLLRWT